MQNSKVYLWSITVALGGLLFGIDTAVISGAEQAIQKLWNLNVFEHGLTVSIALWGTVVGALFGGLPTDRLGRKKTLMWIAILYLVSAVGSALAFDWYSFLFFRLIGGFGVGASSITAPMYIAEVSPASHRGRLVALFQANVVFGILVAYLSNYLLQDAGEHAWRWMLGMEAFPALFFLVAVFFIPESPRWLILKRGAVAEAEKVFAMINPATARAEVDAVIADQSAQAGSRSENLFHRKHRWPVVLAFLFAFFNQVSGINAIIYYAPRIFEMTGAGTSTALLTTLGIGIVNFVFTMAAMFFIDRFGRRSLMLVGSVGLIATLALTARAFFINEFAGVPIFLFAYIAFFAFSQGAVIWVFISEIFPNSVRAAGSALGSFTHWFMASVISFIFPYIATELGGGPSFSIFAVMMVLQFVFVWRWMPETKGKTLEQLGTSIETK
ncbi:MAG: sugar porter family MFS transporter [Cyclobacteriaceae bacterium]|jgi:SP family arabinose:H+ symporter-like MFS transporter